MPTPKFDFYFDVVCPFAFIASERINDVVSHQSAVCTWRPVLLGGLYDLTKAPQSKNGSATDVMPPAKKAIHSQDFKRTCQRYQLPIKMHEQHPLRSVDAGRLLCSVTDEQRPVLAKAIYHAYFFTNENINERPVLLRIAKTALPGVSVDESVFPNVQWEQQLRANTQEAFSRGAFGVPSFWVYDSVSNEGKGKLYFGQDRMHLLEAELIAIRLGKRIEEVKKIERLLPRCLRTGHESRKRTLTFHYDFSSPWSYLAWTQLERVQREAGDGLTIVFKPFLLGALFRAIGTPLVPSESVPPAKAAYNAQDLVDWSRYWGAVNAQASPPIAPPNLTWPDEFPIRSVVALRVVLLEPKAIAAIYRAAWRDNQRISDPTVLASVLSQAGFDGKRLVDAVTNGPRAVEVKAQLIKNTEECIEAGFFGAPTFTIGKHTIWGGDRIAEVQDLILGWRPEGKLKASIAAFPHFAYKL